MTRDRKLFKIDFCSSVFSIPNNDLVCDIFRSILIDEVDIKIGFSIINDTQNGKFYVWAAPALAPFKTRIKNLDDVDNFVKKLKNMDNFDLLNSVRSKCTEPFCTSETRALKLVCAYIWILK